MSRDRGRAGSRAAGERHARAAFPDPHAQGPSPARLDEFHVGAGREPRMVLDRRTELGDRGLLGIFDEQHAMGIADGERRDPLERGLIESGHRKRKRFRIDGLGHRDFPPVEARSPQIDGDCLPACVRAKNGTTRRRKQNLALLHFRHQKRADTARRVAARLHLAAIGVEDAHERVRAVLGRLDHDNLVAADPTLAIGDRLGGCCVEHDRERSPIEDDEIIAQPVHFQERLHSRVIRLRLPRCQGGRLLPNYRASRQLILPRRGTKWPDAYRGKVLHAF